MIFVHTILAVFAVLNIGPFTVSCHGSLSVVESKRCDFITSLHWRIAQKGIHSDNLRG
jgi:hypothetical protein